MQNSQHLIKYSRYFTLHQQFRQPVVKQLHCSQQLHVHNNFATSFDSCLFSSDKLTKHPISCKCTLRCVTNNELYVFVQNGRSKHVYSKLQLKSTSQYCTHHPNWKAKLLIQSSFRHEPTSQVVLGDVDDVSTHHCHVTKFHVFICS